MTCILQGALPGALGGCLTCVSRSDGVGGRRGGGQRGGCALCRALEVLLCAAASSPALCVDILSWLLWISNSIFSI